MYIGCHLSVGDGYLDMGKEASRIGANTFQFFTRNPRGGAVKPINFEDMENLKNYLQSNNFGKVVAHGPFTVNLASGDENKRRFALEIVKDDLMRLEMLPGNYYNVHPGSHVGIGVKKGIENIVDSLNTALTPEMTTVFLLETMAGKGSEIGASFEELKTIYDGVNLKEKVGFCLDTCHVNDGGYDLAGNFEKVFEDFDRILGIENLKAIHMNDSMNPFLSRKDRHDKIGKGYIGIEVFKKIVNHPVLKELPLILETPNDIDGYEEEIKLLRGLIG